MRTDSTARSHLAPQHFINSSSRTGCDLNCDGSMHPLERHSHRDIEIAPVWNVPSIFASKNLGRLSCRNSSTTRMSRRGAERDTTQASPCPYTGERAFSFTTCARTISLPDHSTRALSARASCSILAVPTGSTRTNEVHHEMAAMKENNQ